MNHKDTIVARPFRSFTTSNSCFKFPPASPISQLLLVINTKLIKIRVTTSPVRIAVSNSLMLHPYCSFSRLLLVKAMGDSCIFLQYSICL